VPDLKLSDDGLYYWDGQRWVTTLSHDGLSRWNGRAWIPVAAAPAPPYSQPPRAARVPTAWTKPLQYSVAGWYLLQAIYAIALPFVMAGPMADYFNQIVQRQAQLNPNTAPPPAEFLSTMTTVMTWALAAGAAIGVAIAVVAIIGALRRWTWVFYTVLVLLGLQTVSFPFTVISSFATSSLNPVKLPVEMTATSVALGIPAIAIFIWMLIAAIRRGPWGMTRAA
jgi:hypothetical protein